MNSSRDFLAIVLAAVWFLSIIASLSLFFLHHSGETERVIFFPKFDQAELEGEPRIVPSKKTQEEDILLLAREIVLGPFNVHYDRLLPQSTDVESVLLRGDTLYVDFSLDPILVEEGSVLSFREQIEAVKKTIAFNFPSVERINISFKGETPEFPELK
jgi:hypothetical protein